MKLFSFFPPKILARYLVVGVFGTALDVSVLYSLVEYGKFPLLGAATCSFIVATGICYVLHKYWTFRDHSHQIAKQYTTFVIANGIGLGLNNLLLVIFVDRFHLWYVLAKVLISGIVFFWNFSANRFITFAQHRQRSP